LKRKEIHVQLNTLGVSNMPFQHHYHFVVHCQHCCFFVFL
jgi:hypothetical protein